MTQLQVLPEPSAAEATPLLPIQLHPILVAKPWGGSRLRGLGRDVPADAVVGESWDLVDLDSGMTAVPDPVSRVAGGPCDGRLLTSLVSTAAAALLGPGGGTRARFPLLVKHLDAGEDLSVQVHPPAEVQALHCDWHVKTETWVVAEAAEGAELMLGVRHGVTVDQVRAAVGTPQIVTLLRRLPARVGDVHHVPAGLIHALGAGVVVAEVQTPSDTTFRLYDWTEEYGRRARALHPSAAMECIRSAWETNVSPPGPVSRDGVVAATPSYTISRHRTSSEQLVTVPTRDTARVVLVVEGSLDGPDMDHPAGRSRLAILPASWAGELWAAPGSTWLDIDLG